MKKLGLLLLIAALALSMASCKAKDDENTTNTDEGTTASDTVKDTGDEQSTTDETSAEAETEPTEPTEAPTQKPAPVAQTDPFYSDFSKGADGWTIHGGEWEIKDDAYTVLADPGAKVIANDTMFDDFVFEADIKVNAGVNGGLVFRVNYPDVGADAYYGYYAGISPTGVVLGKASDNWTELGTAALDIGEDTEVHVKVVAKGTLIEVFVTDMDNALISVEDDEHEIGAIGLRVYQIDASFRNIVVTPTAK